MVCEEFRTAIILGFVLSFMVGPVFFVLLETAATKGFRAGLVLDVGVILADILFIVLAYLSSYQLVENLSNGPGLYVFGGVILIVYGITSLLKKDSGEKGTKFELNNHDYFGLFVKGFLLNFINVGVLIFWLGVVIVVGPGMDGNTGRIATFFGLVIFSYLLTDIGKILLAKQLRSKLNPSRILILKKVLGLLLLVSGLVMVIRGFVWDENALKTSLDVFKK